MRDQYGNVLGKGKMMANHLQKVFEGEHESDNSFIKMVQMKQEKFAGKNPDLTEKSLQFSSYMCNNGEHATELARKVTAGLDKVAFPVK